MTVYECVYTVSPTFSQQQTMRMLVVFVSSMFKHPKTLYITWFAKGHMMFTES